MSKSQLKRSLGFLSLVAFGVGDILGAGVYALIGKTAALVGPACWLSFLASLVVAALTGLSYAELGSRFPRSAGESFYSLQAFGNPLFSYLIGFLVLMSGVVSMAVVSHAFTGYVQAIWPGVPPWTVILTFFLVLGVINFLGMDEASLTNIVCTAVEMSGLLLVIASGIKFFGKVNYFEIVPPAGQSAVGSFLQAGVLSFYAFIGFEDMVKAAEESRQPERFIPRAILTSLVIVAFLYVFTAVAAVSVVPIAELSTSSAPLARVVRTGFPALPAGVFTLIALFAVTNTALVNFVMSSRLLYGMAHEGLVPSVLGLVDERRHTPHVAIALVFCLALALALTGTLLLLAQSTALFLLLVFFLMNVTLIVLKFHPSNVPPSFHVPSAVPVLGALATVGLIFHAEARAYLVVLGTVLLGLVFYFSVPRGRPLKE